jgi:hypothetical protein
MEVAFALLAAWINLLAIALYHDKQAAWLNGTAAGCALIIVVRRRGRERLKRMTEPGLGAPPWTKKGSLIR